MRDKIRFLELQILARKIRLIGITKIKVYRRTKVILYDNVKNPEGKKCALKIKKLLRLTDQIKVKVKSSSRVWLFVAPWVVACQAPCPWDFPGKNTGVVCHFLLQGILLTQGLNPGLPYFRQTLYRLSHQGSLTNLESTHKKERCLFKMKSSSKSVKKKPKCVNKMQVKIRQFKRKLKKLHLWDLKINSKWLFKYFTERRDSMELMGESLWCKSQLKEHRDSKPTSY